MENQKVVFNEKLANSNISQILNPKFEETYKEKSERILEEIYEN